MNFKKELLGYFAGIVVGVAVVVIAYLALNTIKQASYNAGFSAAEAKHATALSHALAEQQMQLQAEFKRGLEAANQSAASLRSELAVITSRNQQLEQDIADATNYYQMSEQAAPEPLPACVFTNGFVSLYNNFITNPAAGEPTLPGTDIAAGADATPGASATINPKLPSGLIQSDILQHVSAYGGRCQAIEAQLNQLIDHLEKYRTF